MTNALTNAHLSWHDTKTVTVTRKRSGVADDEIEVEHAKKSSPSVDDIAILSNFRVGTDKAIWNVPASELGSGKDMQAGDTITDGSDVWTVGNVQHLSWRTRWRCVCVLERT